MACPNFEALRDLHDSANNLLHSPVIQQALVHDRQQQKWVHQVSEASLRMLDVCGIPKDVLLVVKQHLQDLQSMLRRASTGKADVVNKIAAYNCYRSKLRKEKLKCLNFLKGMKRNKSIISSNSSSQAVAAAAVSPVYMDHNLMVVVDVLRKVRVTSVSVVESLLSLISIPWLDDHRKSSAASFKFMSKLKLRRRGQRVCDDISCDVTALQSANKRLDAVGIAIQDLEAELDCMFRRLIHTRVALLNILTN